MNIRGMALAAARLTIPPPLPRFVVRCCSSTGGGDSSVNFLALSDEHLMAQCKMDTFRATGPGGQHRNKTESAVRLKHLPTGLVGQACEDRSQHRNRDSALQRLRHTMALKLRNPVQLENYELPQELQRILPLKENKKHSNQLGPNHPDYVLGLQLLLDVITAARGSVADAARVLGLSTGALSKVIVADNSLLLAVNELRASQGMKPLK